MRKQHEERSAARSHCEHRDWVCCKDHEAQRASYTVSMIQKMLELEDYSGIPGYQPRYKRMLRDAFEVWLDEQSSAEI